MSRRAWIGAVVLGAVLVGCAPSSPIVGKWHDSETLFGASSDMTYEYKPDKTFVETTTLSSTISPSTTMVMTGTYELKGTTLTWTIQDAKVMGADGKPDSKKQATVDEELKATKGVPHDSTVEIKGDTMILKMGAGDKGLTFTKVK